MELSPICTCWRHFCAISFEQGLSKRQLQANELFAKESLESFKIERGAVWERRDPMAKANSVRWWTLGRGDIDATVAQVWLQPRADGDLIPVASIRASSARRITASSVGSAGKKARRQKNGNPPILREVEANLRHSGVMSPRPRVHHRTELALAIGSRPLPDGAPLKCLKDSAIPWRTIPLPAVVVWKGPARTNSAEMSPARADGSLHRPEILSP